MRGSISPHADLRCPGDISAAAVGEGTADAYHETVAVRNLRPRARQEAQTCITRFPGGKGGSVVAGICCARTRPPAEARRTRIVRREVTSTPWMQACVATAHSAPSFAHGSRETHTPQRGKHVDNRLAHPTVDGEALWTCHGHGGRFFLVQG